MAITFPAAPLAGSRRGSWRWRCCANAGSIHYERDGEIKIGDTALDSPSKAEAARQERMKREG